MPNDNLQFLKINDFSPGIMQKLNRLSGDTMTYPVGAADATNTFRCIALPGGGLGPLPKQGTSYTRTGGNPTATVTIGKIYNQRFTISGAHIAGPIFGSGDNLGFTKQELHIAYEYGANVSGTQYTRKYQWERHRLWESTPTVDSLVGYATTDDSPLTTLQMRPTWFHTYRADNSSATAIGAPLVVAGWYAAGGGLTQRFWDTFPDPAALGSIGVKSISTKNPEGIFGHQGRSVELDQNSWTHGGAGTWSFNEQVFYTSVNLATLTSSVAAVWGQEDCQGFGAFASMNASEMMAVRIGYGGYIIRGDLDNPTILFVPGIPGTGNTRHNAAITPIGLVYGSRNGGLWAWAGGDTAELLSPQLENNFWQPSDGVGDFVDYAGKMAFWKEWVLTPDNWLYDIRTKSFWRLDDPSVISIYHWLQNTDSHVMYGCPRDIGDSAPSLYNWNANNPATSYSWESQVLPLGDYKTAQPREVLICAQGVGTVAFTVSGYTADGTLQTESHTLSFTSTARPAYQRCTIGNFKAITHCRLKLVSTATAAQTPVIYEAQIGFYPDAHLATH